MLPSHGLSPRPGPPHTKYPAGSLVEGDKTRASESDEEFVRTASSCFVSTGARHLQKWTCFPGGVVLAAPSDTSQKSPGNFEDSLEKEKYLL